MRLPTRPLLAAAASGLVLGGAALMAAACDSGSSSPSGGDSANAEAHRAMLGGLGEHVMLATYVDFAAQAAALETALATWAASGTGADRDAAREAWRTAIDVWQEAEVFQLGPAGVMGEVIGGDDLRDIIYSWPVVNPCRADQEAALVTPGAAPEVSGLKPNARGLDTLEYLLWVDTTDNPCAPQAAPNKDGVWAGLGDDGIWQRRRELAAAIGGLLVADANALVDAWQPPGGGEAFLAELGRAGDGGDLFTTAQEALNALSDAMFYVDKETKDMKLAVPAGVTGCDTTACPDEVESLWAGASAAHLHANVRAMRTLVAGTAEATGFGQLLADVGAPDVRDALVTACDDALVAIEAIDAGWGSMRAAVQDPDGLAAVVAAHAATRDITVIMKSDFLSVLDLALPKAAEGDND